MKNGANPSAVNFLSKLGPCSEPFNHVVQDYHPGEQKSHRRKAYIITLNGNFLCLSCPSVTFVL